MADPRATLSFEGIDNEHATYTIDASTITYDSTKVNGSASVGLAVTLANDGGVIALAVDGDRIEGKLVNVEADGTALVCFDGYVTLPAGNAASTTRGKAIVGALGAASAKGYIREVNTAVAAELGKMTGSIVDAATSTAILVRL